MTIADAIVIEINRLSESDRMAVLDYARSLRPKSVLPPGKSIAEMMKNIEPISAETARELIETIEEGCERIDEDGW